MADRSRLLIVRQRPVAHAGLVQLIEQLRMDARRILGQIDPPAPISRARLQPARPDDGQKHIAGRDRVADLADEIFARRDTVDIHEDFARAEPGSKEVMDTARHMRRIIAVRNG